MQASRYQDLRAWQRAMDLVERIYQISSRLPRDEVFGLRSQMRRCAVSVPSNIAEGQGRATRGEFQQFLGHARGSLYELETQIVIAARLGYVELVERDCLLEQARELGRMLNALIASLKPAPRRHQLTTDN
jgi:four helix bundle protein